MAVAGATGLFTSSPLGGFPTILPFSATCVCLRLWWSVAHGKLGDLDLGVLEAKFPDFYWRPLSDAQAGISKPVHGWVTLQKILVPHLFPGDGG